VSIACIILARHGSKAIPSKNIVDFCGYPLLSHSIICALECSYVDDVFVSSDGKEILEIASQYGAKPIERPKHLSTDDSSSEDALKHFLEVAGDLYDIIVFLQPTSPLRESKDISNAIQTLVDGDYDSVFSAIPSLDTCIWESTESGLRSVTFDYKARQRRQDLSKQVIENGSIYVFRPYVLEKYDNRMGGKIGYSLMESWKQYEIDEWEDLEVCRALFKMKLQRDTNE